ncbi:MAG TPA: hypothetical protein VJJ83_00685, partial [Candidatus Babeliales bacterium]|nr:hypothetical protein [Candidatus Babeliales bacterium]
LSFMVVAPTGNKPSAEFLFEPISGSAGSWEIGGDVNGHWNFWENADCNQSLGLHADVALVTALKHEQTRLFGLKAGADRACSPGASYLMLKELDSSDEYVGLQRAANILALKSSIGAGFEANLGLLLKYMRNNWSADFGYELFHRSAEKICSRDAITEDKYVINGGNLVYGNANSKSYSTADISLDSIADSTTVYVKDADVCTCTALQPSYLSNKFFNNYQYAWNNCDWEPTLLLGYSYEVGASNQGVKNIAVNQWSVLAKGSISF